jgi:hypothetical protein
MTLAARRAQSFIQNLLYASRSHLAFCGKDMTCAAPQRRAQSFIQNPLYDI